MTAASRGLLDTSVVIDRHDLPAGTLPPAVAICTLTLAELSAGPHAAVDLVERARRQRRLQEAEGTYEPLPFDAAAARAYGRVYAAVRASGRSSRGRTSDLYIAAVALAHGLPLYTRNPDDFRGLEDLVTVVAV